MVSSINENLFEQIMAGFGFHFSNLLVKKVAIF